MLEAFRWPRCHISWNGREEIRRIRDTQSVQCFMSATLIARTPDFPQSWGCFLQGGWWRRAREEETVRGGGRAWLREWAARLCNKPTVRHLTRAELRFSKHDRSLTLGAGGQMAVRIKSEGDRQGGGSDAPRIKEETTKVECSDKLASL